VDTPILSRNSNMEAATALAIADPEEADANAMFGAVRLYDQLIEKYPNEIYQVATISGESMGGVEADRKVVQELEIVLDSFKATGVILVTDGYADDAVIPLIQSRVPITSIQHVIVKHSERIEETWAVLFRYLRMLVEDPYYSRVSLGLPGIMLIIVGVLTVFGQLQNAGMVLRDGPNHRDGSSPPHQGLRMGREARHREDEATDSRAPADTRLSKRGLHRVSGWHRERRRPRLAIRATWLPSLVAECLLVASAIPSARRAFHH
jgi:hypothetical protein